MSQHVEERHAETTVHDSPRSVRPLSSVTRSLLRSSTIVRTPAMCLHELLANSIDAGARTIAIAANFKSSHFSVYDDGRGISYADVRLLGQRHVTSKLGDTNDLHGSVSSRSLGWRGEALSSIAQLASMEIETRAANNRRTIQEEDTESKSGSEHTNDLRPSKKQKRDALQSAALNAFAGIETSLDNDSSASADNCTCRVLIHSGVVDSCGFAATHRATVGSTISFCDFYQRFPVRRAQLDADVESGKELERIKRVLIRIALIHPHVQFEVYDVELNRNNNLGKMNAGSSPPRPASLHLPLRAWQQIWLKRPSRSLLENFNAVFNASSATPSHSPSAHVGSSLFMLESSALMSSLRELTLFRPCIPPLTTPSTTEFLRHMSIEGFLSHPRHVTAYHRDYQFLYVNHHLVTHRPLVKAIEGMYERVMKHFATADQQGDAASSDSLTTAAPAKHGRRRLPIFLVHLTLPATQYDLLFDPAKTQIQFKNDWAVVDGVQQALKHWVFSLIPSLRGLDEQIFPPTYMPNWLQPRDSEDEEVQVMTSVEPKARDATAVVPQIAQTSEPNFLPIPSSPGQSRSVATEIKLRSASSFAKPPQASSQSHVTTTFTTPSTVVPSNPSSSSSFHFSHRLHTRHQTGRTSRTSHMFLTSSAAAAASHGSNDLLHRETITSFVPKAFTRRPSVEQPSVQVTEKIPVTAPVESEHGAVADNNNAEYRWHMGDDDDELAEPAISDHEHAVVDAAATDLSLISESHLIRQSHPSKVRSAQEASANGVSTGLESSNWNDFISPASGSNLTRSSANWTAPCPSSAVASKLSDLAHDSICCDHHGKCAHQPDASHVATDHAQDHAQDVCEEVDSNIATSNLPASAIVPAPISSAWLPKSAENEAPTASTSLQSQPVQINRSTFAHCELIGQVDNKFLAVRSGDLFLAVDQHAADERRRLEYLLRHLDQYVDNLALLQPISFVVNSSEVLVLQSHQYEINAWGFRYQWKLHSPSSRHQSAAGNRLYVQSVPVICGVELDMDDLREYLVQLLETKPIAKAPANTKIQYFAHRLPLPVKRILHYKACRSAVMFGDTLNDSTMHAIIKGLATCDFPFNCAHGRPTLTPLVRLKQHAKANVAEESSEAASGWDSQQLEQLSLQLSHAV